ncbi:MAG: hypothetical protein NW703_02370 [Nitrospiraceae bacterium]
MRHVAIPVVALSCLFGFGSLALADEPMDLGTPMAPEMGQMADEMKAYQAEGQAQKEQMKSEFKSKQGQMKAEHKAKKGAMKAERKKTAKASEKAKDHQKQTKAHVKAKKQKAHSSAKEAADALQHEGEGMRQDLPVIVQ